MYRFLRSPLSKKEYAQRFSSGSSPNAFVSSEYLLSSQTKARCQENVFQLMKFVPKHFHAKLCKRAAVLVPLCEVHGKPSMLFTQRAHKLKRNRGEVSFPGGAEDNDDRDLIHTALRETEEEIGLSPSHIDVWTTLPVLPDYKFSIGVHAVIGNLGKIELRDFTANTDEVAHVFTVPVATLCDPKTMRFTKFRVKHKQCSEWDYTTPIYLTEPRIWGLTACIVDIALGTLLSNHKLTTDVYTKRRRHLIEK